MSYRPACLPLGSFGAVCCCLFTVGLLGISSPSSEGSELRRTPIVRAVEIARPSVVNIRGEKTLGTAGEPLDQTEPGRRVNGMGTGVVIDEKGFIVTNFHVVDGVREIQVTLADGQRYTATLVARDPETDLAIIKINTPEDLPVIRIGKSSDLMTGESVVAVGNAYGYEHTVTRGIISALHRAVQVSDAQSYNDLIQTDASINPGNSGGPLLNIDGEMIGINVAVRAGAQGIGFAIPIDKAMVVVANLLAEHNLQKGWHGLVLRSASLNDPAAVVASVEKQSPALEAGLKPGDVITKVDEREIHRPLDFQRTLLNRQVGERIAVSFRRGQETLRKEIALTNVPAHRSQPVGPLWQLLGLELKPISANEFRAQYQTRYRGGLVIEAVRQESPAAEQGIRPGDVLVGMHVWETISLENVSYILNRPDFKKLDPVKIFILRGNDTLFSHLPIGMTDKTALR